MTVAEPLVPVAKILIGKEYRVSDDFEATTVAFEDADDATAEVAAETVGVTTEALAVKEARVGGPQVRAHYYRQALTYYTSQARGHQYSRSF